VKTARRYISGILLAAGESRRMGKQKLLLPLKQSTILEQAVDSVVDSGVSEVIVVLGHETEDLMKLLSTKPVKIVLNPDYKQGMSASIRAGVKALHKDTQGIMIFLADMPFIEQTVTRCLINNFIESDKGIVVPTYDGRRGHPVIFSSTYRDELLKLQGDEGGKRIIDRHPEDLVEIEVGSDTVTRDIDTPTDYIKIKK
jgi:molybdenum cofactor cytidylyltransferase